MKLKTKFYILLAFIAVVVLIALPREDKILSSLGIKDSKLKVRQGLDLQGGASLLYQANLKDISSEEKTKAINGVIDVLNKRVNPTGTSEALVQTSGSDRVLVQLPGEKNIESAISLIGKTAELNFYEVGAENTIVPSDVSGKDLDNATVDIDSQSGQPVIAFTMKSQANQKFADLTTRINKSGTKLLIVLDDQPLFNGTVSTPITDGRGQMTGFENVKAAQDTAVLLNAGALPVPIDLVQQQTVGASLGSESIAKSLIAGFIGILAVIFFMIAYYRLAGVVASLALIIYTLINIDIFKISVSSPYPIVLTLAGIAGFILSIGMAVDANILIFERWKEEVRDGSSLESGLEAGFGRAWNSIRDSNISTLITCIILYNFGLPIIKGFAVTLAIGVLISMFTAITVSKTILQMLMQTNWGVNEKFYRFTNNSISNNKKIGIKK